MEQTELSDDRRCRMTLREKMMAVIVDVNASVAERAELIELIAIALLTRKNLFIRTCGTEMMHWTILSTAPRKSCVLFRHCPGMSSSPSIL